MRIEIAVGIGPLERVKSTGDTLTFPDDLPAHTSRDREIAIDHAFSESELKNFRELASVCVVNGRITFKDVFGETVDEPYPDSEARVTSGRAHEEFATRRGGRRRRRTKKTASTDGNGAANGDGANGDVEVNDIETPLSISGDKSNVVLKNVGAAEVRTRSGTIEIENASGFVDAVTTSGPIRVRKSGGDVRVFSINGLVEIECATGRVNVDNANGTINLTNIGGDVDANTSNSNITFTGAVREDGRYHLNSMSGAIEMAVQDKPLGFTAVLSSYQGIIEKDFELKVKQASEHEEKLNHRIIGSYGSGRAQIILATFDGKINLHKIAFNRFNGFPCPYHNTETVETVRRIKEACIYTRTQAVCE